MLDSSSVATWKAIPGWDGWYEVSDNGHVRSVARTLHYEDGRVRTFPGKELKPGTGEWGHQLVGLSCYGTDTRMTVHSAVMATFVGPRPDGLVICHRDGNARNNHVSNLRYDTPRENTFDNVRNGTHHYAKRDKCKWGHLLSGPNLRISPRNERVCRACHKARGVLSKARVNGQPVPEFNPLVEAYYAEIMACYTLPVPLPRVPLANEQLPVRNI